MYPVFHLFGLTLPVGPVAALLAFYLGSELGSRAMDRYATVAAADGWRTAFSNATFIGLVAGLIGARLGYAARFAQLYLAEPRLFLSLRPGTLAWGPGLLVGLLAGLLYLRRYDLLLSRSFDAAAIGAAGALATLSLGHFLTGDAYGVPTTVPWAVPMWDALRHPVQLYTAAAFLLIAVVLWWPGERALPGQTFWRFVMLAGLSELVLSAFRANPATVGPGIRTVQVYGLGAMLAAMFVLSYYAQQRDSASAPADEIDTHSASPA